MKRIYLIILGLIFLCLTCNKQEYHYVPDQYKPNLEKGDTIIYSNGIKYDSFILQPIMIYEKFEDKKYHYEEIRYNFHNPVSKLSSSIVLSSNSYSILWEDFFWSSYMSYNAIDTQLIINSKLYSPVYKIPIGIGCDTSRTIFRQLYYNHKVGVVRYITKSKDTFNIMNK